MSGDRRDARVPGAPDGHGPELLTAYVDGIAELPPDERQAVEAWLAHAPDARAEADAVKTVLGRVRALPPGGGAEPDWAAMERSIRQAVDAERTRPWWRSWRWLVPAMTCATAAGVLLVIWPHSAPIAVPRRPVVERPAPEPPAGDRVVALWLDGAEVDVDVDSALGPGLGALDSPDPLGEPGEPDPADDAGAPELGLLPATDLVWLDQLDAAALDRAERWLAGAAGTPSSAGGAAGSQAPQGPHSQRKKT
jgi:hypothetical protein